MKNLIKISLLFVAFACMATTSLQAQKFGYVFSVQILAEFPETKIADANLETLQKQLQKKFETMYTDAQKLAQKYQEDFQAGNLSPLQQEEAQNTLAAEEKKMMDFQKKIQKQIEDKRNDLYGPILEKVDAAIKEVAKAEGLTMVFNADTQVLLYADESTNITDKVKAKLGML